MLRAGFLLIKIREYCETADVNADLKFIKGRNNQIAFLMTPNQKQFFTFRNFSYGVFEFELYHGFRKMDYFCDCKWLFSNEISIIH